MVNEPDIRVVCSGIPYWFFAYFLLPSLISLSAVGAVGLSHEDWVEIAYHLVNFIFVLIFFFPYLKESFLMVQLYPKDVFGTAAACAVVIVVLKLATWILCAVSGNAVFAEAAFGSLVTTEADLLYYSTALIGTQPIWGTLCLVFLVPFTITCLFYASVFAPICTTRPWLAYLLIAVLPVLPRLSLVFCLWPLQQEMAIYLLQLPIHLIACWSYQKTDTVWTPIATLVFSNLASALLSLCVMGIL